MKTQYILKLGKKKRRKIGLAVTQFLSIKWIAVVGRMDFRTTLGKLLEIFHRFKIYGIIDFQFILRFICLKRLNINQADCVDFETRFCCPISRDNEETREFRKRRQSQFSLMEPDPPEFDDLPESHADLRNFKKSLRWL